MRRITAVRDSSYSSSALLDSLTCGKKYCRSCLGLSRQKALLRTLSFVVSVLPSHDGLGTLSCSLSISSLSQNVVERPPVKQPDSFIFISSPQHIHSPQHKGKREGTGVKKRKKWNEMKRYTDILVQRHFRFQFLFYSLKSCIYNYIFKLLISNTLTLTLDWL